MLVIALADIHGRVDYLPAISNDLSRANLVLIAGDITHFGGRDEARRILSALREYNPHILAVPGNCDKQGVDDYLRTENMNLSCNCININGVEFVGMGGSSNRVQTVKNSKIPVFFYSVKKFVFEIFQRDQKL